jgi:5-methyltetrahydrofolate--homocysteine methyltransferase
VLINSISGEEEKLERILPLAVKYGASVIGLTLDDNGIPPKASQRLQVAQRILDAVLKAGMSKENLVIDCLTLAASVEQELVMETLLAIELIKKELDLPVVLGVSNVSFGLPRRKLITSSFLAMAIASGLDGAILNPKDARMLESLHSASVLAGRDYRALKYMELYGNASSEDTPVLEDTQTSSPRRKLFQAVVGGHEEEIPSLVEAVLQDGIKPMEISNSILIPALEKVGEQFNSKDFFLPQVMLSAESAKIAFDRVKGELEGEETISRGKIIMATVQGDIHDIGKNIVSMLLENHGYQILDLGVNVPAEKIITLAEEEDVDIIGLSALMTTTMREMSRSVESIKHKGIKCPVMVGGAAVTREYALEIGADGYGKDAVEAVELVNKLLLVKN